MEDNEDEPEDVKRATLVEEEIRMGEIDQDSGKPTESHERRRHHQCGKDVAKKKLKEKSEDECCNARRAKASKAPKTATVYILEKECVLPKIKAIPRHCLTKQEWIDILATPSRKCPSPCLKKPVVRRIRPVSPRMAELAQPPKQRLINTLQSRAGILPTELIDNLIQNLEGETCLTPEQAEQLFRDKEIRSKKKSRKKKRKVKCIGENYENSAAGVSSSAFDKDAVNCQYLMAESFVRSILDWKCPIPREEFKDIAQVILKRLGFILEYNPVNGEDKKSQQMRFLADLIGSWISGVLFEVAEARKTELDEECERRRKAKDEESEEESEEDSDEDLLGKDDDDDEDDDKPKKDGGGGGGGGGEGDGGGGGGGGGGADDGGAGEGGKDDHEKKDSEVDDGDEEEKGRRPTRQVRESMGKSDIDRTEEDEEKPYDPRTETSEEIGEKKTPLKKPEVPEEAMAHEISDERAVDGKIEGKEAAKPEEKNKREEFPKSGEKSVPLEADKPETTEMQGNVIETGKLPDSSVKDSAFEEPKDEASEKSGPREITKESEPTDDRVNRQFKDSEPPEVSKAIVEKEPMENIQDGPSAKIVEDSGDSSIMAGTREADVNKEDTTKIEEEIRKEKADGKKVDTPTSESAEGTRAKPEGQLDSRVESEEEKRAEQRIIDEEGKRKTAEEAKTVDDPSAKTSAITESPQTKVEVTLDPRVEREEDKQIRKATDDEEETKKTDVGSEKMENLGAGITATSEPSQAQPEVTLDPRTKREQEEDARKEKIDEAEMRKEATEVGKVEESSTKAAETSQDKSEVKLDPKAKLEEDAGMREMMTSEEERKKTEDRAKTAKDPAAEAAKTSEVSQATPELAADLKIDAEEEKTKEAKEASIPTSRSPDREKLAEEDEERRGIIESSKESSYPMELGEVGKRKMPEEYPSGLTIAKKYRNDTPFVTFDRIFHTIYNAIEESEENNGADPIINRLHRVVYGKFSNIVQEEKREPLTELTKDVLEVMSGKIAKWLKNVLTESQMNFANKFPATVESTEIREWTEWISGVSDSAEDWSKWIRETIKQAEGLSSRKVTRGDWAKWTKNIDVDALRWRALYLEARHRAHQNLTMVRDRQVVKSGTAEFHDYHEDKDEKEREVKITDLQEEKRNTD